MDPASTSFVLGYHGCDGTLAEKVFAGRAVLRPSHNDYDWLGDGIYFWEHSSVRAFRFAREVAKRPHPSRQKIAKSAVVGAIIDLGYCLNLLDSRFIEVVRLAYDELGALHAASGSALPKNSLGQSPAGIPGTTPLDPAGSSQWMPARIPANQFPIQRRQPSHPSPREVSCSGAPF